LDLLSQVPLAVQPGAGDPRRSGDRVEADRLAGGVQATERGDGALAGLQGAAAGSATKWWVLSAGIGHLLAVIGSPWSASSVPMIRSRLPRTCWFISTSRSCPLAVAVASSRRGLLAMLAVLVQEPGVVMNTGQVRQALACGHACCTGSLELEPLAHDGACGLVARRPRRRPSEP
jgi:hypothetical protein